jgi:hypothetical protein
VITLRRHAPFKLVFYGGYHLKAAPRRIHEHHESAFYLMSGEEVELCTGDRLDTEK